ncbi:unnamed protein product [Orchesella dallaii]|uniref:Phosphatidylinositol 4-kinase type 2 n=1 Tax=Orchesella dallaii TaxID=48710 RepID=A0ABP1RQM8_9HEXA
MNPKWAKWFQRQCCPCCFGRGCLVPNSGYLSEAGASLVDLKLGLNIVPKTQIVRMASSTFHYGKIRREAAKAKKTLAVKFPAVGRRFHRIGLPRKVGSFQLYVDGFKDAIEWLQKFETEPLPEVVANEFQLEFEKLVILDYMIRNTDRGNDNWLLRYDTAFTFTDDIEIALSPFSLGTISAMKTRRIKIAAIDNGLAFPFKHPDEWRAYPFQWSKLSHAKLPFSETTRNQFLPLLSNVCVVESLCSDLYRLFSVSKAASSEYWVTFYL